ncbi:unnamed protein product [Spirodela intermedia]|uniref:Late embryogenesis abundant protein LEA-2 subgroup domain-containing protein n=1 Tax=Spirodela intermedia TaxID=51605 RepID=A0ABN7EBQ9_SPIIN|nr:unnamed protein product [Spirodela intermedia]
MAERTYPPSKPVSTNGAPNGSAGGGAGAAFPATKAQLYGATRPVYRPQAPKAAPPRRRRGGAAAAAAAAYGIFYVIYRPHRPSFSVSSLKLSTFNVTTADAVTSRLDLSVTARNPNKKLVFLYEPISISATTGDLAIGDGSSRRSSTRRRTRRLKTKKMRIRVSCTAADVPVPRGRPLPPPPRRT